MPVNCTDSELSTFLQVLGEGYFPTYYSDTSLSAPSRSMSIASKSFRKGKQTGTFLGSRFSMTLPLSTAQNGEESSMSSRVVFHALTFPSPEKEQASKVSTLDCGPKWPGSLARYNPGSRSWRTAQCSLLGGLTEFSVTFPRWGMMRSGELFQQPTPVLRIEGKGSGSWLTPTASDTGKGEKQETFVKRNGDRTMNCHQSLAAQVHATANTPSGNWPTPTCSDAFTDKLKSSQQSEGSMHSVNLSQAVQIWRTPTVGMLNADRAKDPEYHARKVAKGQTITLADEVKTAEGGGQLNPDWVEWLMNWPVSWSSLTPLSHEHFNEWLARTKASATKIQAYIVPGMRNHGQPSQAPQGPEQAEQHAGEHCDTVPSVPREGTREAGGLGKRQCSPSPLSDMRTGVPVEQNAEGQGVQQCLHGGDGQAFSGEAMGRTEQGEAMHELREDLHLHTATSNDLQPVVREYSGPPKPWWSEEPIGVPRVATGIPKRADRLKAIGNGQVPAAVALAWHTLYERIQSRMT